MKIAIPRERRAGELRVAASPDTVKKLKEMGFAVTVETGAGKAAAVPDAAFKAAGASIARDMKAAVKDADIVFRVRPPAGPADIKAMKKGAVLVSLMDPYRNANTLKLCASQGVTAFAMELLPRITRAQSMDVLSSQASLAGYRAVIDAAAEFGRAFPRMSTAAGAVPPTKVFVMGVGVAGLQAVATAKRLGAVVSATDVRRAAGEEVKSLGAKFIMVETEEDMQTEGGYAKALSAADQKKQAALVSEHIADQDIVITTALIPGRDAPRLVTRKMLKSMPEGAVVVDMAVEAGGNVEGAKAGETVTVDGVAVMGLDDLPSRVAVNASQLYARNLLNFLTPMVEVKGGTKTKPGKPSLKFDPEDEVVTRTMLTRDGAIVHDDFKGKAPARKAPAKKAAPKKAAAKKAPAKKAAPRKSAAKRKTGAKK